MTWFLSPFTCKISWAPPRIRHNSDIVRPMLQIYCIAFGNFSVLILGQCCCLVYDEFAN
uniref:Uncharacterized protein n=1 Tax=Rhizophora mucronata TaxID=61149 RepID=A0A2P2PLD9_RHIMU